MSTYSNYSYFIYRVGNVLIRIIYFSKRISRKPCQHDNEYKYILFLFIKRKSPLNKKTLMKIGILIIFIDTNYYIRTVSLVVLVIGVFLLEGLGFAKPPFYLFWGKEGELPTPSPWTFWIVA